MRILAIVERHAGRMGQGELEYQLRRVGAPDDLARIPDLIRWGLLDEQPAGMVALTDAGRARLSAYDAQPAALAVTGTDGPQRASQAPEPPGSPALPLDVDDLAGLFETIVAAVPLPAGIPPRRMREARPGQKGGIPYTEAELVGAVHLWKQLTEAPPSRADWSPEMTRRHGVQSLRHVLRWARAAAYFAAGDFPNVNTVRKTKAVLDGRGFEGLLQLAGYLPRTAGTTPNDHPSARPSYDDGPTAQQRGGLISATNRAITAVINARKNASDTDRLRNALYRLRDAAEREADTL